MRMTLGELRNVIREEVVRLTEMGAAPDREGDLVAMLAALTPEDADKFVNHLAVQLGFGPDPERAHDWLKTWGGWTYGARADGVRKPAAPARGNRGQFSGEALQNISRALDSAGLRDINAAAMYYGTGGLEKVVAELLKMM